MIPFTQCDDFSMTARVLGVLFYYAPDSAEATPIVDALTHTDWHQQWPLPPQVLASINDAFHTSEEETLPQAWQRLLIGPWALPAPPWGSVWLDHESVIFGDSTLALREWMRNNHIQFMLQQNEPEDHIGALLLMTAWLAENGRHDACEQLLAWHILPWASHFLDIFIETANHSFYRGLGQLAQHTLAGWRSELLIPVAEKPFFR